MKNSVIYALIIVIVASSFLSGCANIDNASSEILNRSDITGQSSDVITSDIYTTEVDSDEDPDIEESRIINDMFSEMGIYFCCTLREVVNILGGMGDTTDTGRMGNYSTFRVNWIINDKEYKFDFCNEDFRRTHWDELSAFCMAGDFGKPLDEYEYIFDIISLVRVYGNGENKVYCPNRVKVDASFFPDYDEFIKKYNNGEKVYCGDLSSLFNYLDLPERAVTEQEFNTALARSTSFLEFIIALGVKPHKYSYGRLIYKQVIPPYYDERIIDSEFYINFRSDLDSGDYSNTFLNPENPTKEEYDAMINYILSFKKRDSGIHDYWEHLK